jgi:hypothetical protein
MSLYHIKKILKPTTDFMSFQTLESIKIDVKGHHRDITGDNKFQG